MLVSVVIPSYDMAEGLERSLRCLSSQRMPAGTELEVQVVDDGSTDHTRDVPHRICGLRVQYQHRARDELSCRSRARNLGLRQARGEVVVFMDAGILVACDFIAHVAQGIQREPRAVTLYPTLGLFAESDAPELDAVASVSPEGLKVLIEQLRAKPAWRDPREELFELGLAGHPAPWVLGWSCAMSVPSVLAKEVAGFDEDFIAWGAEDLDFANRLHRAGGRFQPSYEAVLHLPHPRVRGLRSGLAGNLRRLWSKDATLASETLCVLPSRQTAMLLPRLERLALAYLTPDYESADAVPLLRKWLRDARRSALVFPPNVRLPALLGATHTLSCTRAGLNPADSSARQLLTLGCATRFEEGFFDVLLCTDAIRLFERRLRIAQMRELKRISKTALFLFAPDGKLAEHPRRQSEFRDVDGWGWATRAEMQAAAKEAGLGFHMREHADWLEVYELC